MKERFIITGYIINNNTEQITPPIVANKDEVEVVRKEYESTKKGFQGLIIKEQILKVYISGKISGLPLHETKKKFLKAKEEVIFDGNIPVNPFEIITDDNLSWKDYMIADIRELFNCDAIYMLKDWRYSKGARIEKSIAKELGLKIFYQ